MCEIARYIICHIRHSIALAWTIDHPKKSATGCTKAAKQETILAQKRHTPVPSLALSIGLCHTIHKRLRPDSSTDMTIDHIAISACNFRSSSSSSSSSTRCCGSFWFGAAGILPTVSLTGTLPVLSISSSSFSCCSSASSSSSSSSSMPVLVTPDVIASLISSPIACCSRRSSLKHC